MSSKSPSRVAFCGRQYVSPTRAGIGNWKVRQNLWNVEFKKVQVSIICSGQKSKSIICFYESFMIDPLKSSFPPIIKLETKHQRSVNANQPCSGALLLNNRYKLKLQRYIIVMEIGECSIDDEDSKPAVCPQHLTTTSTGLDDGQIAVAESGIVSFPLTDRYWWKTVLLVSVPRCTLLYR